ncbi:hypothetical protein [Microbacterium sp. LEMMJ01]|uniref:hypothetical protein n=1 Tax=Microbacterium sp. LEMMJ01 TaxID=1978350 RepID=UPI00111C4E69|nr:hypothetical protein [Microbacterium sp. LEMMJ01]
MTPISIVIDTLFLAQVEDPTRWEERFDLLIDELRKELGPNFFWPSTATSELDVLFLLYPPGQHERMVTDRVIEAYVSANLARLKHVHVIVIGRNSKSTKVTAADVVEVVNTQCIPQGLKAASLRALQPEDLDDDVRAVLFRTYSRRQGVAGPIVAEATSAEGSDVMSTDYSLRPLYESIDL